MSKESLETYLNSLRGICEAGPTCKEVCGEFLEGIKEGKIRVHFVEGVPVWRIAKWNDAIDIFFPHEYSEEKIKFEAPGVLVEALRIIKGFRPANAELEETWRENIRRELSGK